MPHFISSFGSYRITVAFHSQPAREIPNSVSYAVCYIRQGRHQHFGYEDETNEPLSQKWLDAYL